jgi:uncharacterized protein
MTQVSMYSASVPVFTAMLKGLAHVLQKAIDDAAARKFDGAVLVKARLAPDMFPLSRQVQIATDFAKGCVARLAGVEAPAFPDTETTLEGLRGRVTDTLAFLATIKPEQVVGSEDKPIELEVGPPTARRKLSFNGHDYLGGFATPNFYFHVTTAYAILRHNGVPLGKADFFGG